MTWKATWYPFPSWNNSPSQVPPEGDHYSDLCHCVLVWPDLNSIQMESYLGFVRVIRVVAWVKCSFFPIAVQHSTV